MRDIFLLHQVCVNEKLRIKNVINILKYVWRLKLDGSFSRVKFKRAVIVDVFKSKIKSRYAKDRQKTANSFKVIKVIKVMCQT